MTAWNQFGSDGPGLGPGRITEIEASLQTQPQETHALVAKELHRAAREEVPLLLGIVASTLRLESDLDHAELVLRQAIEMTQELEPSTTKADLLIRRSYVALERQSPSRALRHAQEATLTYARFDDREGEGRGFLTTGLFLYHSRDYRNALVDFRATLRRTTMPRRLIAAHQIGALCWLELGDRDKAREEAGAAREMAPEVDPWMHGKLSWLDARLVEGSERFDCLRETQEKLSARAADCLLVSLELVEELVSSRLFSEAQREIPLICDFVERIKENKQVLGAVSRLVRHREALTPPLVAEVQRVLDRARDQRLSRLISAES